MEYYILKLYQEAKKECPDVEQGFDRFEPQTKKTVISCFIMMVVPFKTILSLLVTIFSLGLMNI